MAILSTNHSGKHKLGRAQLSYCLPLTLSKFMQQLKGKNCVNDSETRVAIFVDRLVSKT